MTARQHHFVPQCYLRGFLRPQEKAKLFVVDAATRRSFETGTENVAQRRDFHAIQADGIALDAFENAYAKFEGELGPALRRINAAGNLNEPQDRAYLMNLMCVTAVKNPRQRESFRRFHEAVSKQIMQLVSATPERWDSHIRRAKEAGYIKPDTDTGYEKMREFITRDEYDIELPSGYHLDIEMDVLDKVLPCFFERKWVVFRAPERSSGFITSDHPVCLMWADEGRGATRAPPGYGMQRTQVLFPVSHRLAVIGAFEFEEEMEIDATEDIVANINSLIILHSDRQIYARDSGFHFRSGRTGRLVRGIDLLSEASVLAGRGTARRRADADGSADGERDGSQQGKRGRTES